MTPYESLLGFLLDTSLGVGSAMQRSQTSTDTFETEGTADAPAKSSRHLVRHTSVAALSADLEAEGQRLTDVDPERAPWLQSILRAYETQKLQLEVGSHAYRSSARVPFSPAVAARCTHRALVWMQQVDEALKAQEDKLSQVDGIEQARAAAKDASMQLGLNSGVVHTDIVDDGRGMRARFADGSLMLHVADVSTETRSTLGRHDDASGN